MPIFEYACKQCGKEFEALVLPTIAAPSCPACQSTELEKLISSPAIKSESTHGLAMAAPSVDRRWRAPPGSPRSRRIAMKT